MFSGTWKCFPITLIKYLKEQDFQETASSTLSHFDSIISMFSVRNIEVVKCFFFTCNCQIFAITIQIYTSTLLKIGIPSHTKIFKCFPVNVLINIISTNKSISNTANHYYIQILRLYWAETIKYHIKPCLDMQHFVLTWIKACFPSFNGFPLFLCFVHILSFHSAILIRLFLLLFRWFSLETTILLRLMPAIMIIYTV